MWIGKKKLENESIYRWPLFFHRRFHQLALTIERTAKSRRRAKKTKERSEVAREKLWNWVGNCARPSLLWFHTRWLAADFRKFIQFLFEVSVHYLWAKTHDDSRQFASLSPLCSSIFSYIIFLPTNSRTRVPFLAFPSSLSRKSSSMLCVRITLSDSKRKEKYVFQVLIHSFIWHLVDARASFVCSYFLIIIHRPNRHTMLGDAGKAVKALGLSPVPKESLGPMSDGLRPLHH